MKQKIGCLLIFLSISVVCSAQQVISSGGYFTESEISFSWVIGGNLTHVSVLEAGPDNPITPLESPMSLKIYPNPAIDFFNVEITPSDTGQVVIELYNSTGMKMLVEKYSLQPVIQVDVSDFPSGAFLFKAYSPSNEMYYKTQKVFKK